MILNRRLDQIEKRLADQTGGDFCRHAGDVQIIEREENGDWEHKVKEPEPCGECGLFSPVSLRIIIDPGKLEGES